MSFAFVARNTSVLLLLTTGSAVLPGCKSFRADDLQLGSRSFSRFGGFEIDEDMFRKHFWSFQEVTDRKTGNPAGGHYRRESHTEFRPLPFAEECRDLLMREGSRALMEDGRPGKVVVRVMRLDWSLGWGWMIPTGLSLGTLTLLGFPHNSCTAEVGLDFSVQDENGNVLSRYRGVASATKYSAMYWGYRGMARTESLGTPLPRATIAHALLGALEDGIQRISTSKLSQP